uniref:Nucleolin binding domain protein n=1 Tax=CrAss-like virus sp. ctYsL76 TaxID=2826826 RepID=A0A8S5QLS6_9CAUD|nr:MAG TPA: Nucleolin binding domain protein [CrAss-like virus sp. ctYsL76]
MLLKSLKFIIRQLQVAYKEKVNTVQKFVEDIFMAIRQKYPHYKFMI